MNNEGMRRMLQLMSTIGNGREEQANTRERGWAGDARKTNDERRGRPVGYSVGSIMRAYFSLISSSLRAFSFMSSRLIFCSSSVENLASYTRNK